MCTRLRNGLESDARTTGAMNQMSLPVVRQRHTGRWIAAILIGVLAANGLLSLATNPNMGWSTVGEYLFAPVTLRGVVVTISLTVIAMVLGALGGIGIAVMRISANPVLSIVARGFIWFFRGTPVLVQIIFWGYLGALYPDVTIGIPFTDVTIFSSPTSAVVTPFLAAVLALGLNEMAYAAEIVRGGISSVDRGQTEAALASGLAPGQTIRKIVLPQAMRVIIPPMGNEVLTMLKTTALVSVIAGQDLMTNMQRIYSQTYEVIPLLVVASIWYLALTTLLSFPQAWLERRYGRGFVRRPSSVRRLLLPGGRNAS